MNHNRDMLLQEEKEAMFPAFQFSKGVTEAVSAVGDACLLYTSPSPRDA